MPTTQPECKSDTDCPGDKACVNRRCQNPCILANPCGTDAECKPLQHRPVCRCRDGWSGNPQILCYKRKQLHFKLLLYKSKEKIVKVKCNTVVLDIRV